MDTDKDKSVRRFVRWLKDKIENKRNRDGDHDPWWVTLLLDVGRPVVAVMILTMCAPGEHYLAVQAGWSERLAWGMPGTLTAYAGIAAVVATKRPKGAPGRRTAVWGAIVSVALAMAAQPVAHLYGRTGVTRETIFLTVVMGLIPAAVFGHLLHMGAASPKTVRRTVSKPDKKRADKPEVVRAPVVANPMDSLDSSPDNVSMSGNGPALSVDRIPDMDTVSVTETDSGQTPRRMSAGSMRTVALSMINDNPAVNSIYVAIKRARRDWRQTA